MTIDEARDERQRVVDAMLAMPSEWDATDPDRYPTVWTKPEMQTLSRQLDELNEFIAGRGSKVEHGR